MPVLTSSALLFAASPDPASVLSVISKVSESALESPVMVRLDPVTPSVRVSVDESATGFEPAVPAIVSNEFDPAPPVSALHAHTSLASFHLSICPSLQPCNSPTPPEVISRPDPEDTVEDKASAELCSASETVGVQPSPADPPIVIPLLPAVTLAT